MGGCLCAVCWLRGRVYVNKKNETKSEEGRGGEIECGERGHKGEDELSRE